MHAHILLDALGHTNQILIQVNLLVGASPIGGGLVALTILILLHPAAPIPKLLRPRNLSRRHRPRHLTLPHGRHLRIHEHHEVADAG